MTEEDRLLAEEAPATRWRELARLERWLDKPMLALAIVWLALVVLELTTGLSPFMEGVGIAIWIAFIGDNDGLTRVNCHIELPSCEPPAKNAASHELPTILTVNSVGGSQLDASSWPLAAYPF